MNKNNYFALVFFVALSVVAIYFFQSSNTPQPTFPRHYNYEDDEEREKEETDSPDLAAEQEFEMTKDPTLGYVPTERKVLAFQEAKGLLKSTSNARAISDVKWVERGPDNVGGRTRSLFFDPNDTTGNKVWAGAVAGGLWYNNNISDKNSAWHNVNDFMANLAISTLAYDPEETSTFYAGTGLGFTSTIKGAGIWRSTDKGNTWSQLSSTQSDAFSYVQKIVVSTNSKVIAGTSGGLYTSIDNGETWTLTSPEFFVTDVELASNGDVYISDYNGNIFKSTDDAATWVSVSPMAGGDRVEITTAPSNSAVIYALAASGSNVAWLKKSINGGLTWQDITIPNYRNQQTCTEDLNDFTRGQAFFDLILQVSPNNEDLVLMGGIDLYRTTDGGTNWQLISYWTGSCAPYVHADQHAIVFKPGNNNTAIFGNDGGVFYSENLNDEYPTYLEANNGYNTTLFYSCAAVNQPLSSIYLAGSQDNGTQKFTQMGINSTQQVTGGDGAFVFIDQNEPNIMISSYVYNNYYYSLDGGGTFYNFPNQSYSGRFINPCDYDDIDNTLYAASSADSLNIYSNIGSSTPSFMAKYIPMNNTVISHIKVSPDNNVIFAGNGYGQIYQITNPKQTPTVTEISNNQLPSGNISCIEVGNSTDHLLVTLSNYGINSIWETKNGGTTWTSKEGNVPDVPVRWALFHPTDKNQALIATDVGIWSTDNLSDISPEWEPTVEGLANVRCDMIKYRTEDKQLIVATHGRGLFTSNVFGSEVIATFAPSHSLTYINKSISFAIDYTGDVNSFHWDFGDGTTSTDEKPKHKYTKEGHYTITLTLNEGEFILTKDNLITVMPTRAADYSLEHGGNFEVNYGDFYPENINGTPFELGKSTISGKSGTASGDYAWVTGINNEEYASNSTAILYTPEFDFSQSGSYTLKFEANYQMESEWDGMIVTFTPDKGENWYPLGSDIVSSQWYDMNSLPQSIFGGLPIFSGTTNDSFISKSIDISMFAGYPSIAFQFYFASDGYVEEQGIAIDNFIIEGPMPALKASINYQVDYSKGCNSKTVVFTPSATIPEVSYAWDFGEGATPQKITTTGAISVTFDSDGSHEISLIATDTLRSSHTDSTGIVINFDQTDVFISESSEGTLSTNIIGNSYQWLLNGNEIPGATASTHSPSKSGDYTVIIKQDECNFTSSSYTVKLVTGVNEYQTQHILVYPNPFKTKIFIDGAEKYHSIYIYDTEGRLVYIDHNLDTTKPLDLSTLKSGYYIIELRSNFEENTFKIFKTNE